MQVFTETGEVRKVLLSAMSIVKRKQEKDGEERGALPVAGGNKIYVGKLRFLLSKARAVERNRI